VLCCAAGAQRLLHRLRRLLLLLLSVCCLAALGPQEACWRCTSLHLCRPATQTTTPAPLLTTTHPTPLPAHLPACLPASAGLDSAEIVSQMRAAHAADPEAATAGVDVVIGGVGDMRALGIYEAFKVKNAALLSATEAAEMILRVDDIIRAAPRQREGGM
jgi:hypothetical protein